MRPEVRLDSGGIATHSHAGVVTDQLNLVIHSIPESEAGSASLVGICATSMLSAAYGHVR